MRQLGNEDGSVGRLTLRSDKSRYSHERLTLKRIPVRFGNVTHLLPET